MKPFDEVYRPDENVYYIALSAAQKCIRRCDVEGAVNFAKVAWKAHPFYVWRRMWVWLGEDCCRNVEALKLFYNWRGGVYDFEAMIPLIKSMASGPKDKAAACVSAFLQGLYAPPLKIYNVLKNEPIQKKLIEFMRVWRSRGVHSYDEYDFHVDENNYDWVIELVERAQKHDKEKMTIGIPYFFMKDTYYENKINVNEAEPLIKYEEFLPLEAVDYHTRPGQAAYRIYLRHNDPEFVPRDDLNVLGDWLFHGEGWKHRNYQPYYFDFVRLLLLNASSKAYTGNQAIFLLPEVAEILKTKILPQVMELRRWVLRKMYKEIIHRLKIEYYRDYIR